jgi:CRP-like cAMP-binding protein
MNSTFTDFGLLDRASDEVRKIPAGQVIIDVGDPAREFFVIRRGKVVVRIGNRTLDTLGDGDVFGEMALIDAGPRSATVIAETDCEVTPVSEKQFLFMISEAPYFALSVMRVLVDRLRRANQALPGD